MVDDDPLVLTVGAAMLEDLGYEVLEASSGRQALDLLDGGARVDLVVTDQSMPGMTGARLGMVLRQAYPGLPVLLATGFAERDEVTGSGLPVISKPFDGATLAAAIEAQLNAAAPDAAVALDTR
jgi:CheY-like chemotaxis protein